MTSIDYSALAKSWRLAGGVENLLGDLLLGEWAAQYRERFASNSIFEVQSRGWAYLLDFAGEDADAPQPDRAIGCCGLSDPPRLPREWAYQRGYPTPPANYHRPLDKGHMMPHELGGDVSQNIYPQDRALNRGWSAEGRRYRALEREAAARRGTFFFCKLEYDDESAFPVWVELGILRDGDFHVDRFRNRFDLDTRRA